MHAIARLLGLAFLLATTVSAASAQTTPHSDRARIRQGVRSGQLTRREATRARVEQAEAQQARQAARADGVVTPAERRVVRQEEKQADRVLYRQKHDAQTRRRP